MYYLIFATNDKRNTFIAKLRERDIDCVFHYVPLHSSPAGLRYGRASGSLAVTERVSDTLVRLPLWIGLEEQINRVIEEALRAIRESA
jgi:dTDP-4-amino-4,6-dideoxygalactose transaminase